MTIDAHVHLWTYDRSRLDWIDPASPLAADHGIAEAIDRMDAAGIGRAILVQAEQAEAETDWLLGIAAAEPRVAGVVGWTDLRAGDVEARVAALDGRRGLVGLRHIVQAEADGFLAGPAFVRGVRACVGAGLSYDILVFARQAGEVPGFLDAVGPGRFVLDHGAKPEIAAGGWEPWAGHVRAIAAREGVWCKLSGLVTEADHHAWEPAGIERYMAHLLDCFGPERLIFGSDWPVCTLAADYAAVHRLAADFVDRHCPGARDAVFSGNAMAAYGLAGA